MVGSVDRQPVYRTALAQRQAGDIYLQDYSDGLTAQRGLARWFETYNQHRPHQALDYATPGSGINRRVLWSQAGWVEVVIDRGSTVVQSSVRPLPCGQWAPGKQFRRRLLPE